MEADHIFIFSRNQGAEADELVNFGLTEGSSRVHTGQGTTNRKFYFENFFLEILWVHDQSEIKNDQTKTTRLWERSNFSNNAYTPFGLCLVNTEDTDQIFKNALTYQPEYFPDGMTVDFISEPQLPWLFRLPFRDQKKAVNEPLLHSQGLKKLTKATFTAPAESELTRSIQELSQGTICFQISEECKLTLEFDNRNSGKEHSFQRLPLTMEY